MRSKPRYPWLLSLVLPLVLAVTIAACSAPQPEATSSPVTPSPKPVVEKQETGVQSSSFPPALGEALRQDLSQKTGKAANQFQVVTTSRQTWPDGCLGLAKPEEVCTQMLVQGWQVVLSDGQQQWTYRSDRTGRIYRRSGG